MGIDEPRKGVGTRACGSQVRWKALQFGVRPAVLCWTWLLSHVRLSATPWTGAHQAALSMGILQARVLEWLPCPPPGNLPNPGIEPRSLALQADSLPSGLPRKNRVGHIWVLISVWTSTGGTMPLLLILTFLVYT